PGDVDFRRLSAMRDLLGWRHRSRCENGVQGIRARFNVAPRCGYSSVSSLGESSLSQYSPTPYLSDCCSCGEERGWLVWLLGATVCPPCGHWFFVQIPFW